MRWPAGCAIRVNAPNLRVDPSGERLTGSSNSTLNGNTAVGVRGVRFGKRGRGTLSRADHPASIARPSRERVRWEGKEREMMGDKNHI